MVICWSSQRKFIRVELVIKGTRKLKMWIWKHPVHYLGWPGLWTYVSPNSVVLFCFFSLSFSPFCCPFTSKEELFFFFKTTNLCILDCVPSQLCQNCIYVLHLLISVGCGPSTNFKLRLFLQTLFLWCCNPLRIPIVCFLQLSTSWTLLKFILKCLLHTTLCWVQWQTMGSHQDCQQRIYSWFSCSHVSGKTGTKSSATCALALPSSLSSCGTITLSSVLNPLAFGFLVFCFF